MEVNIDKTVADKRERGKMKRECQRKFRKCRRDKSCR